MIKTLSPYYVTIPFISPLTGVTCSKYTLKIYVWDGLKSAVPSVASYSMTKTNPTSSTGSDKINIARLINDFIDFAPQQSATTGLINGVNQRWCRTTFTYTTTDEEDFELEQLETIDLIVKGYGYGMDGQNSATPVNRILMDGIEFKVNRTGVFNVPIKILAPTTSSFYFTGLYPESTEFSGGDVFYLDAFGVTQVSSGIFSTECRLITALEITATDSVIPCTP